MSLNIQLKRVQPEYQLFTSNESGHGVHLDASPSIGGTGNGVRPMELVLMGLAGCSTIDIITFLKKFRQELKDISVDLNAEREPNVEPSVFTTIHAHYKISGNVSTEFIEKALKLSLDKYCSVARILEKTATITYSWEYISEDLSE